MFYDGNGVTFNSIQPSSSVGWYNGYWKSSNETIIPLNIKRPDDYDNQNDYPVLFCLGGTYGHKIDLTALNFFYISFTDISNLGGGVYLINHGNDAYLTVNEYIELYSSSDGRRYIFQIIIKNSDGQSTCRHHAWSILPDINTFVSAQKSVSHYRWGANPGGYTNNSNIGVSEDYISIVFSNSSINKQSGTYDYEKHLEAVREMFEILITNNALDIYYQFGTSLDIDVTFAYRITVADNPDTLGSSLTIDLSIDSNRIYTSGMSAGALSWVRYIEIVGDYIAGILCIDGAYTCLPALEDFCIEAYGGRAYAFDDYWFSSFMTFDDVNHTITGDLSQYEFFRSRERVDHFRRKFLYTFSHIPLIDVTSDDHPSFRPLIYPKLEMMELIQNDPVLNSRMKYYFIIYVKSPEGTFSTDGHISGNMVNRAGGIPIDGYVYTFDTLEPNILSYYTPEITDFKTGLSPLELLFTFNKSLNPQKMEIELPEIQPLSQNENYEITISGISEEMYAMTDELYLDIIDEKGFARHTKGGEIISENKFQIKRKSYQFIIRNGEEKFYAPKRWSLKKE